MGRKLVTSKNGKRNMRENESFLDFMREELVEIYLIVMLAVYPLVMKNGYRELVYGKWKLLLYASVLFIGGSAAVGLTGLPKWARAYREKKKGRISATDTAVILYLLCVLISYAGAVDRQASFYGVSTWNMGLAAQMIFAGIYFAVSRGYVRMNYMYFLAGAVFLAVCGILLLQRFGMDPLSLYEGLSMQVRLDFVTTMGQVTWSSSYISIMLIMGIGSFFMGKGGGWKRMFSGCVIAVGFAAEAVLNCDSGMLAVGACLMVLFWFAIAERERMLAFLEIVMLGLAAFSAVGVLERIFADRMVPIDAIYLRVAQSGALYALLAAAGVSYLLLRHHSEKSGAALGKRKKAAVARGVYAGFILLGILGVVILFILHGKGYFAGSSTENYFRFTVWWGNSRGFIWRTGAAVFADFNLWRKLFGCGPDGFTTYAYRLMGDAINEFWSNQIVPNVHNEWFNAIINYGLAGGLAYLAIFVTAAGRYIRAGWKAAGERPELFGVGLSVIGYLVHNVLCYQQMVGTPLIFILMGLGEAMRRRVVEHTNPPCQSSLLR